MKLYVLFNLRIDYDGDACLDRLGVVDSEDVAGLWVENHPGGEYEEVTLNELPT